MSGAELPVDRRGTSLDNSTRVSEVRAVGLEQVAAVGSRRAGVSTLALRWLPPLLGAATVGGLAASNGGYFAGTCAWASLGLLWFAVLALLLRSEVSIGAHGFVLVGALALFVGWSALSWLWTSSVTLTMLDVQKLLVYVGLVLAALLVVSRRTVPALLGGVLAGNVAVCAYALATRLFPERLGRFDPLAGYRLESPVGYWNALGLFAGLGILLAAGFAARAERLRWRAASAALLPLLMATFFFTFSRGAWAALAVGAVAALALDPRRLQLLLVWLLLGPWPGLAVALADGSHALTTTNSLLSQASHQGHRLAVWVVVLGVVAAAVAAVVALIEQRARVPRGLRTAFGSAVALGVVAGAAEVWARYGSPSSLAHRAYHAFLAPTKPTQGNLANRLLDLSSNNRVPLWKVAWHEFERHPAAGSGAGTFQQWWFAHRPNGLQALDAHGLYQQTLGELGIVGLVLLLGALLVSLAAAARARRSPLVPAVCGAYVAFLLHGAVDWDWQLTGVAAAGLLCAVALVVEARPWRARLQIALPMRTVAAVATIALATFAFVGVMANVPLDSAQAAADRADWSASGSDARKAETWAPWSSQPWQLLGEAELAQAKIADARRSFLTAVAKDPRNPQLWVDLAIVTTGAGRRRALATAERLDPREPSIRQLAGKKLITEPVRK